MKSSALIIAGLILLAGCKTIAPDQKTRSQLTEFRKLRPGPVESVKDFQLNAVERLGGDPIEYTATNQYFKWQPDYEEPHLKVTFPSLTNEQFNALKKVYGFALSQVQYRAGEVYTLDDFLMPFMQATVNHEFESEIQDDYTRIASNCWGTAYEIIRTSKKTATEDLSRSVVLFYADTPEMQAVLQDDKRSTRLGMGDSIEALYQQALTATTPMEFGDVVLILDAAGNLLHVVTYIDRDVWFEKVGYSGGSPYRLTTTAGFFHKIKDERTVEWRRFPRGGLPHPSTVFKTWRTLESVPNGTYETTAILDKPVEGPLTRRDVKFVFDEMGRASLEASAFKPARQPAVNESKKTSR